MVDKWVSLVGGNNGWITGDGVGEPDGAQPRFAEADRSVMAVREKSATVIDPASGASSARSLSPNFSPRIEAFKYRLAERRDS